MFSNRARKLEAPDAAENIRTLQQFKKVHNYVNYSLCGGRYKHVFYFHAPAFPHFATVEARKPGIFGFVF